jgi:hypothetical protein
MTPGPHGSAAQGARRRGAGWQRFGPEGQLGRGVDSSASWAAGRGVERAAACCCAGWRGGGLLAAGWASAPGWAALAAAGLG